MFCKQVPPALPTRPVQPESLTHLRAGTQGSTFLEKSAHILQGGPFPSAPQGSSVSGPGMPVPRGQSSNAPGVREGEPLPSRRIKNTVYPRPATHSQVISSKSPLLAFSFLVGRVSGLWQRALRALKLWNSLQALLCFPPGRHVVVPQLLQGFLRVPLSQLGSKVFQCRVLMSPVGTLKRDRGIHAVTVLLWYHTHLTACVFMSSHVKSLTAAQLTLRMFESHYVNMKSCFQSVTSK